jgi:hypothetical protein
MILTCSAVGKRGTSPLLSTGFHCGRHATAFRVFSEYDDVFGNAQPVGAANNLYRTRYVPTAFTPNEIAGVVLSAGGGFGFGFVPEILLSMKDGV